jgi:hypothetical protein
LTEILACDGLGKSISSRNAQVAAGVASLLAGVG